eukprot:6471106-Prymnesium_polylepis.1
MVAQAPSWVLPIDGHLVSVQPEPAGGWRVDVGTFETDAFVAVSSFALAPSPQLHELVATKGVVDTATGVVVPVLAFRSSCGTSYCVGLLDLDDCAFECWQSVQLAAAGVRRAE